MSEAKGASQSPPNTYTDGQIAILTKSSVGLGNVDNTADVSKPVSTAQQTALDGKRVIYKFTYDFAVLGGAAGTINLTQANGPLPNNLVIQEAILDVITALGSGGASVAAVTTGQAANDLVAATVIAGTPFSTTGPKVTIALPATIATWIKTTAARTPAIVVTISDLNAGKFNLFVSGYLSA